MLPIPPYAEPYVPREEYAEGPTVPNRLYGDEVDEDARADAEKESGRSGTPEVAGVGVGPAIAVADDERGELLAVVDDAEAAVAPMRSQGLGGETMVNDKVAICHMQIHFDQCLGSLNDNVCTCSDTPLRMP